MTRILVLYASTHGHTAKIAGRIAEAIGARECAQLAGVPAP